MPNYDGKGVDGKEIIDKVPFQRWFTNSTEVLTRGAPDIFYMFVGHYIWKGNDADVFLGSFSGEYSISDIDYDKKTAKVKFTVYNTTGWGSATKIPKSLSGGKGHIVGNEIGSVYDQIITWDEIVDYGKMPDK